jgi:hypothetical protein
MASKAASIITGAEMGKKIVPVVSKVLLAEYLTLVDNFFKPS